MPTSAPDDALDRLKDRLDEATQREAEFRFASAQEYLALQTRVESQIAALAERDAYIHQLHLERIAQREALQAAHADLEAFTWMLQESEKIRTRRQAFERSWAGKLCAPLRWLENAFKAPAPATRDLPGAEFVYHLSPSPYRLYREKSFQLRGWAFLQDHRALSGIRIRVDEKIFPGRYGLEEPEIVARYQWPRDRLPPGFEIEFATPPGQHWLRLEACLPDGTWRSVLNMPFWCRPR